MAERRSTYVFSTENDYDDARDHIFHEMYSDYNDSNKIHFYGSWGSDCWRIDIYSDCSDAPKAADIFREHRGKYYSL